MVHIAKTCTKGLLPNYWRATLVSAKITNDKMIGHYNGDKNLPAIAAEQHNVSSQ